MSVAVSGVLKSMPSGEFLGVRFGLFGQGIVPGEWCHAHLGPCRVVHVKRALQVVVDVGCLGLRIQAERPAST